MGCKGICKRYKGKKDGLSWYTDHKRCSECAEFIKWDGLSCPCCNFLLRVKPKRKRFREKLIARM